MTEYVICTTRTNPGADLQLGTVYAVLERKPDYDSIKIHKGTLTAWSNAKYFEPFEYFKDDTPAHAQGCLICSTYGANLACVQCRQLLTMARQSYRSHVTDKERAREILGQLCYFDVNLAIPGDQSAIV